MMNPSLLTSLTVCLALLLFAGCAHHTETGLRQRPSVEQELAALEHELSQAYATRNVAALERIFANEYTFTQGHNGSVVDRNHEIEKLRSGKLIVDQIAEHDISLRDYGDFALVTLRVTFSGSEEGKPFQGHERITDVFVRRDGRWQCVHSAATPIQP
ncbi:MAG: nuclear transport factor 2 family protein [Verrucomicrobiae bacterium]|nr:nuclear transport factor 2 family protein [Verrucomicrobiae bacterium]